MKRRFLTAEWRHLVMLNYAIDPAVLRPLVPRGTDLDTWNGQTLISVVGFRFLRTRLLGLPIPFHRNFDEVNLRFYVRRQYGSESRRGVVFVKEIVPKVAIALVARLVYNENYVALPMASRVQLPDATNALQGFAEYRWGGKTEPSSLSARFAGEPAPLRPGSEEEFITEHYWGYVVQRDGSALEYGVEHPPWRVWRATEARFDCDVERHYGKQFRAALEGQPTSAFVADGSAIAVFRGEGLPASASVAAARPSV